MGKYALGMVILSKAWNHLTTLSTLCYLLLLLRESLEKTCSALSQIDSTEQYPYIHTVQYSIVYLSIHPVPVSTNHYAKQIKPNQTK